MTDPGARRAGSRPIAVLAVAAGAGLAVLATGRPWVTVSLRGATGAAAVTADGRLTAPAAVAIALVALAGAVVLATSGRAVRTVVAVLLLVAGLGVAALSVPVWRSPRDAAGPAVASATGTVGRPTGTARTTPWPAVSALGGLLIVAGGITALARGRRWAGPSRRFDPAAVTSGGAAPPGARPAPRSASAERDRRMDEWDSLSRGEDPTEDHRDAAS